MTAEGTTKKPSDISYSVRQFSIAFEVEVSLPVFADWEDIANLWANSTGVLVAGKSADLVILDQDPTRVDPSTIRDIPETWLDGECRFQA